MGEIEKRVRRLSWRRGDGRPRGYRPGPFALIYSALLAAGLVAAAGVYYVLVHNVPGMAANRADTMKTALLVIGGSGALAGLYVAYRKQRTDEANHLRDQDKLFTERYTAAVAQLGNTASAAIRLGGVYALARIADDSERDRPTCLKVLCAYLRMPYDPDDPAAEPAERQVRTAAQTALAERLRTNHPGFWTGAEIDLTGAYLIEPRFVEATFGGDARFDGATFSGNARFHEATFGADARFDGATFAGDAGFFKATFGRHARFDKTTFSGLAWFVEATFGTKAEFAEARFSGEARFNDAMFVGDAWFNGATFSRDAWFAQATFGQNAGFGRATFGGNAWFSGASFGVFPDFGEATFHADAWFSGATFSGDVAFVKATFHADARFDGATFSRDAWFDDAMFSRAHPPIWPEGFAEPAGMLWDPPGLPVSGPDPGPPP